MGESIRLILSAKMCSSQNLILCKTSHFRRIPAHSSPQCKAILLMLPLGTGPDAFGLRQPPSPPRGMSGSGAIPNLVGSDLGRLVSNDQPPIFVQNNRPPLGMT
jgi:hypothetical protein